MKEKEKLINGTLNVDNLFIVHDALVLMTVKETITRMKETLMTAKETITRMKENNYFHHWLLPMNGFQDGTHYYVIPVDDIP